jgi:hypothetical protein
MSAVGMNAGQYNESKLGYVLLSSFNCVEACIQSNYQWTKLDSWRICMLIALWFLYKCDDCSSLSFMIIFSAGGTRPQHYVPRQKVYSSINWSPSHHVWATDSRATIWNEQLTYQTAELTILSNFHYVHLRMPKSHIISINKCLLAFSNLCTL